MPRRFFCQAVPLPLVEVAVLGRRDELLRRAAVVGVVGLVAAGQGDHGASGGSRRSTGRRGRSRPARAGAPGCVCCGSFSATTIVDRPLAAARTAPADLGEDVRRGSGVVVDVLRGVEPQAVEVELVDPVGGVGDEELADRPGVGAVEVDRLAPVGLVAGR